MLILIAILLGVLVGTITGIVPGLHINLVAVMLLSLIMNNSTISILPVMLFIVSMSVTHTFLDFIPSIYLGCPDEDTALSVLPGHRLLLQGKGFEAIMLSLIGSFSACLMIITLVPLFIFGLPRAYPLISSLMPLLLMLASVFLIAKEKHKLRALVIFILAGFLGIATLNTNIKEPLLPLLTGLFGGSSLLRSIKRRVKLPEQKASFAKPGTRSIVKGLVASLIAAPFCAFMPGLGASQAAIISSSITKLTSREFIITLGAINTLVVGLSFITLYSIGKARTGVALAVAKLTKITANQVFLILFTILLAGALASVSLYIVSRILTKAIMRIDYKTISIATLIFVSLLVLLISGPIGLLIFATATSLGIATLNMQVRRTQLMACLLVPTILFYLLP